MHDLFGKVELWLEMQQSLSHGMKLKVSQITWERRNKAKHIKHDSRMMNQGKRASLGLRW